MNVVILKEKLDALADAIGIKSKVRLPLTIDEQIEAVNLIETDPKLQDKQVTLTPRATAQTKTVTADDGYDGLGEVAVKVKEAPLINYNRGNLTSSGSYTFMPSLPYIGYSAVRFNVPISSQAKALNVGFTTLNNVRKWRARPYTYTTTAGWVSSGYAYGGYSYYDAIPTGTTVTPSSTAQTIGGANVMMEGPVTVEAVPSGSYGTGETSRTKSGDYLNTAVSFPNFSAGYISFQPSVVTSQKLSNRVVTPTTSQQVITPTFYGEYLESVTVDPIPSEYIIPSGTKQITANGTGIDVTQYAEVDVDVPAPVLETVTKSYTPTTSQQTETVTPGSGYDGIGEVDITIGAMPAGSAGTPVATKGAVSNHSVEVTPSVTNTTGYIIGSTETGTAVSVSVSELVSGTYVVDSSGTKDVTNYASASVPAGTAGSPALSVSAVEDHAKTIRSSVINQTGWITGGTVSGASTRVSASDLVSGTKQITSNGTNIDVTNYAAVDVSVSGGSPVLETVSKSYTPAESAQSESVTPGSGYDGIGQVDISVGAISSSYVGSAIDRRDSTNLSASGATVTAPAGYYAQAASKAVASGTEGTPTATKGTVSNHAVTVTPSVTNGAGYISGGTHTGTGVSVSASELVSGNKAITQNGSDIDVTNFATVSVNVEGGGGGMTVATATKTLASAASSIQFTGLSGAPTSFVITASTNQSTGGTKAVAVVYDGTSCHGMDLTSQAVADTGFSQAYSGDTLTVTATTASFQATEYNLVYTYGGTSANIGTANVQVGSGATSITFTGLTDEPDYFSCIFKSSFSTSSGYQRVMEIVYDGTNIYGFALDSSAHALTSWSYTYNSGSLTISSASTSNGGYFHQPGDYQLTYGYGGTVTPVEIEVEPLSVTQNGTYTAPTGKAYTPVTVNVSGGGSVQYDTKTATASDYPTSLSFTSMKGEPKAFVLRLNAQVSSSGSTTYYYIVDVAHFGTTTHGNCFRIGSTRRVDNITSGYSYTYSNSTLTITSSASSRSASPGAFYNGSYELLYAY